jgi:hypothetical protein
MGGGCPLHCHPQAPVLVSTTLHLLIPCTANPAKPCGHDHPVLETTHLAGLLVRPASQEMPEVPPPVFLVLWRFGVRHVGTGNRHQPRTPTNTSSDPKLRGHPFWVRGLAWPRWKRTQRKTLHRQRTGWRIRPHAPEEGEGPQCMHATLFLGCTDCCGSIGSMCWDQ